MKWSKLEEEAIREYGRQCMEACAAVCDKFNYGQAPIWIQAEIRAMLKEKTE